MKRVSPTQAALLLALLGLCGWLFVFAAAPTFDRLDPVPGSTPAEARAQEYADITRAARTETLAFLAIDYTKMDELTDRVLDGAAGEFKKQYQSSVKSLKESAISQESISRGRVDQVGLSETDDDSATVFVSAGSKVQNKGTKGEVEDRTWRIKLTMVKEGSRWLISKLEFVG